MKNYERVFPDLPQGFFGNGEIDRNRRMCNSRPSTAVLQLIVKQRQHHRILRHCQEHLVGDPGNADAA